MSHAVEGPWVGRSGASYAYHIFDIDADVPSRHGNYIYAKKNHVDLWVPVYMGYGDLSRRCVDPMLLSRILAKGASSVHLRLNARRQDCVAELNDLLARYRNSFPPDGCNDAASPEAPDADTRAFSFRTP